MESKAIFYSITISFVIITISNLFIYSHYFIPDERGAEAWIENVEVTEIGAQNEINLSFTIKNLYERTVPFTYYIFSNQSKNSIYYYQDVIFLHAKSASSPNILFQVDQNVERVSIEITNGEFVLNLHIRVKDWK